MLIRRAACKLNLALEVTSRRGDGWHDLDSLLVPIDWHDLVGVTPRAGDAPRVALRVTGPRATDVPDDERNLAWRAATVLLERGPDGLGFDVWLDKHVPLAAGLGGGSADAAAVLRCGAALLAARDAGLTDDDLRALALSIGSDVPALLAGGAQRVRGRGELLQAVALPALHVAVATAGVSDTAASYAHLVPTEIGADGRVERAIAMLRSDAVDDALLGSALEPAACRAAPALAESFERLRACTPGRVWHLTGSGGALFCMAHDAMDAARLAAAARSGGFAARACRTQESAALH